MVIYVGMNVVSVDVVEADVVLFVNGLIVALVVLFVTVVGFGFLVDEGGSSVEFWLDGILHLDVCVWYRV